MPQLSGTVAGKYVPSAALVPKFIQRLQAKGVTVTRARVHAESLRPTQTTGDVTAIRGIADSVKAGTDTKPIVISSDNRVLDGHHNWAGRLLADSEGGGKGVPAGMPVVRVGLPIRDLLTEASAFGQAEGIAKRKTGVTANPAYAKGLSRLDRAAIELVGPKGYVHGWRFEGIPADSLTAHTPGGKLTPARQALHERIISKALAGTTESAHPTATFMGGGPASGKSEMLKMRPATGVVIDPDAIKAQLPEYKAMTTAGNKGAAAYVHEESSQIAKDITARAVAGKRNFTLDGTGDSDYSKLAGKVAAARKAGYKVHGQYVTVDTKTAVDRAAKRGQRTGRVVPETYLREIHASVSGAFRQAVANNAFDTAELWDNNGGKGLNTSGIHLIGSKPAGGTFKVTDPAAYARFLAKENESVGTG